MLLLNRNGVDTEEAIYGVTYYGKARMPVSYLVGLALYVFKWICRKEGKRQPIRSFSYFKS